MAKKTLKTLARVLSGALTAVLIFLLGCQVYTLAAKLVQKQPYATVFGFHAAVVLTGSMSPEIEPNDLIVTRAQDDYAVGDIVTYQTDGAPVTHRIVARTDGGFITQGDTNNAPDAEIPASSVIGRVVLTVPKVGAVIGFLQTPLGILCMAAGLGLLLFLPNRRKST